MLSDFANIPYPLELWRYGKMNAVRKSARAVMVRSPGCWPRCFEGRIP